MSSPIAISLSRQLSELGDFLKSEYRPATPEGHFAVHVYEAVEEEGPLPKWGQLPPADELRQGQGPPLAAAAYQLVSPTANPPADVVEAWEDGLRRLSGKNAFPIDRQTFAFRPLELYGLALGTSRLLGPDNQLRTWLKEVLTRLAREVGPDPWAQMLGSQAAKMVAAEWSRRSGNDHGEDQLEALSLRRWFAVNRLSQVSVPPGTDLNQLDGSILRRSLTSFGMPTDVARAAVLHHALRRAVHERLESDLAATWLVGRHTADTMILVANLCRRFHVFALQLQNRYDNRSTVHFNDEYDVQDAMRALLYLHFADVRPEEWTPSYGGKSTRMDFLLKREQVVVEVKMTRKGLKQKELIVQLTEDKERYRAHPECRALVCFIYDPTNLCENPAALESDLSVTEGDFRVSVVVAPQGS